MGGGEKNEYQSDSLLWEGGNGKFNKKDGGDVECVKKS